MTFESFTGVGTTIIAAIVGVLGINKYYNIKTNTALEKKQDKISCEILHKGIEDKFETIKEVQEDIQGNVKDLVNHLLNKPSRPD